MQMFHKFAALAAFLFVTSVFVSAQTPEDMLKKASKAIDNIGGKKENVAIAEKAVDDALNAGDNKTKIEGWLTKARLYEELTGMDNLQRQAALLTKKPAKNEYTMSALNGAAAVQQAIKLLQPTAPDYKKQLKKVLEATTKVQANLNNYGQDFIDNKDYVNAYNTFKSGLDLNDFIKTNGGKSSLDDPKAMDRQNYLAALLSTFADKKVESIPLYEKLIATGKDTAIIYSALYEAKMSLKTAADTTAALAVLTKGRAKYPEDSQLLFSEINYFLKQGKLSVLTDKLKEGIKKEPNNPSLYFTLGNVYDNLGQQEKDPAAKADYEKQAMEYYNKTLSLDSKNVDAIYSIGASFYNKAAKISAEMKKLESDFSKAAQKKYDDMEKEMQGEFDKALPYFKKAEGINPNDQNTLTALKEIYARKNDLKTSTEFKTRLQTIQDGGKNATSFFKE